jgi:hypothetical protein
VRQFALTTAKGGINRQRDKGGASPDTLYDLVNGYVTQTNSIRPRPGSRRAYTLPEGTKGMCAFREKLHVFSADVVASSDPMVVIDVLRHPESGSLLPLKEIHFAAPFLGFLYVVAEWLNGEVFHYWLQETGTWQANHMYLEGEVIQPTIPNGYAYQVTRLNPAAPLWKANEPRTVGDIVEPTTANGFQFEVVDTAGLNPASGATEPAWVAEDGALTYEDVTGNSGGTTTPPDSTPTVPPSVEDRYGTGVNANREGGIDRRSIQ